MSKLPEKYLKFTGFVSFPEDGILDSHSDADHHLMNEIRQVAEKANTADEFFLMLMLSYEVYVPKD